LKNDLVQIFPTLGDLLLLRPQKTVRPKTCFRKHGQKIGSVGRIVLV